MNLRYVLRFTLFYLLQLIEVTQRILSFPVTSPVMKILTGLEVLLRKAQVSKLVSIESVRCVFTRLFLWREMFVILVLVEVVEVVFSRLILNGAD